MSATQRAIFTVADYRALPADGKRETLASRTLAARTSARGELVYR